MDDPDFDVPPPPPPPITSLGDVVAGMSLAPKKDALARTEGPKKQDVQFEIGAAALKDTKAQLTKAPPPQKSSAPDMNDDLKNMIAGGIARLRKVGARRPSMGEAKGLATNQPVKYPMPTKATTGGIVGVTGSSGTQAQVAPAPTRCAACKLVIPEGTDAMESGPESNPRMYHPACFKCYRCREPIGEGSYSFVAVGAGQEEFHEKCLGCNTCSTPLILTAYTAFPPDGNYYCREHVPRPLCVRCNQKIMGKCVEVGGSKYHSNCFECSFCHSPIAGAFFLQPGGGAVCQTCYELNQGGNCTKCRKLLSGEILTMQDSSGNTHKLHSHCFVCTTCGMELNGEKVGSLRGEFFCVPHWREEKKKTT